MVFTINAQRGGFQTLLFDIDSDPNETKNVAEMYPEVVKELLEDVEMYKKELPKAVPYWMVTKNWTETFVGGNGYNNILIKA